MKQHGSIWQGLIGYAVIFISSCCVSRTLAEPFAVPPGADLAHDPATVAYVVKTVTIIPVHKNGSWNVPASEAEKLASIQSHPPGAAGQSNIDRLVRAAKALASSDYEVVVLKKQNQIDPDLLKEHLELAQGRRNADSDTQEDANAFDDNAKATDFVATPDMAHGEDWIFEKPSASLDLQGSNSQQNRSLRSFLLSPSLGGGGDGTVAGDGGEKLYTSTRYCGFSPKVDPSRLSNISPGQFPWAAAILSPDNKFLCSGTLISNSIVMTTASCVVRYRNIIRNNQPMKVVLGAWSLPEGYEYLPELQIFVSAAALHPNFNVNDLNSPVSIANNLALLRLIEDVDFDIYPHVFPICAIGPNLAAQASTARCQVLGWPDLPEMETWRTRAYMASGEVHVVPQGCPGSPSGVPCVQGQACVGNEGSVVQCLADSNRYYQLGMIVQEPNCNRASSVTVSVLNVINHYDFISDYIWTPNPNPQPPRQAPNPTNPVPINQVPQGNSIRP